MNPMLTRFPESVRIDGVRYPLNTDFRVGLRIMSAYEDPQLTRFERQVVLCRLLYQEQPSDFTQAVREGVRFLDGGEQPRETGGRRLYSFDQDGAYIYSAILQTHGIDLQTVKMHCGKFRMLTSGSPRGYDLPAYDQLAKPPREGTADQRGKAALAGHGGAAGTAGGGP